ncbi:hypothetical protein BC831DRAFT_510299 [Entophlyctis helioformis]|nr:hypothetical protein BC831DRAFT_510299 [Entophlyctis helioformis]
MSTPSPAATAAVHAQQASAKRRDAVDSPLAHDRQGKRRATIPGPAGALPSLKPPHDHVADADFGCIAWQNMLQAFAGMDVRRSTVSEAIRDRSGDKIACLVVLVKEVSKQDSDAGASFKDPTGDIRGTIHRDVCEAFPDLLGPGAVIELTEASWAVAIFKPTRRSRYLNVTMANISSVFTADGDPPRLWKSQDPD